MLDPHNRRRRPATLLDRYGQQLGLLNDRRHVEAAREVAQDILERRVREKTAELERANADLQTEVSVRKRAEVPPSTVFQFSSGSDRPRIDSDWLRPAA
jgi:C4-dicarboxylate-specific signal transduction histidine kinase